MYGRVYELHSCCWRRCYNFLRDLQTKAKVPVCKIFTIVNTFACREGQVGVIAGWPKLRSKRVFPKMLGNKYTDLTNWHVPQQNSLANLAKVDVIPAFPLTWWRPRPRANEDDVDGRSGAHSCVEQEFERKSDWEPPRAKKPALSSESSCLHQGSAFLNPAHLRQQLVWPHIWSYDEQTQFWYWVTTGNSYVYG